MITILIFLALLSVLVFVHEFGHFIVAKKAGMKVEEFGFGFPPRMFGIKKGETLYSINWLPLGGFVKIKGENGDNRTEADSFGGKKVWQRIAVLSAGVIMNLVLAAFLLTIGYAFGLPQALEGIVGGNVRDIKIQILEALPGSPAEKAGLQFGDVIKKIDAEDITSIQQMIDYTDTKINQTIKLQIVRGNEVIDKDISVIRLESTGKGGIGIGLLETGVVSYPIHIAIVKGVQSTYELTGATIVGLYTALKNLIVTGKGGAVSGPVGIAVMTGQVAKLGFSYLIQFAALLSVNLAVINFLPFPALDGGRVIFVLIEKVRGRPLKQQVEGIFHAVGFLLLIILVLIVTFKDIVKLIH